jgi:hypothetical protein
MSAALRLVLSHIVQFKSGLQRNGVTIPPITDLLL